MRAKADRRRKSDIQARVDDHHDRHVGLRKLVDADSRAIELLDRPIASARRFRTQLPVPAASCLRRQHRRARRTPGNADAERRREPAASRRQAPRRDARGNASRTRRGPDARGPPGRPDRHGWLAPARPPPPACRRSRPASRCARAGVRTAAAARQRTPRSDNAGTRRRGGGLPPRPAGRPRNRRRGPQPGRASRDSSLAGLHD